MNKEQRRGALCLKKKKLVTIGENEQKNRKGVVATTTNEQIIEKGSFLFKEEKHQQILVRMNKEQRK